MTTRSTKMIPMGAASNNPTATASPNHPTPTKRKRSQLDLTTTATPAPTSWLGIAFQLPSVIKKEINDFVKANESTRTRRYLKRSSRPTTATNPRHPQRCSPARTRKTPEQEEDRPPRLPSPHFSDFDLPSPNKKLRRAEKLSSMTLNDESGNQARNDQITQLQQQQHAQLMSLGQPIAPQTDEPANINHSPPTPLPHSGSREHLSSSSADDLSKSQDGPAVVQQSHEQYGHDDAEVEEILSHRAQHAATPIFVQSSGHPAGSNSVLFPDSRHMRAHDSPGSSVNADVSSSTWQASSSFSTNSGSNLNRGFSNHTSLTSNTSVDLNALQDLKNHSIHSSRLNSGCSMPSPRIRHTKILGSPRSSSRMNTLSASSFSSVGSIINTGLSTHRSFGYQLAGAYERTSGRIVTSSLNNLAPTLHPSTSDNEREFLTSDSDNYNDEPADIQIGRRIISQRPAPVSRRKVPLAEIIGRPLDTSPSLSSLQSHLDTFRETNELNPSPSIASIASAFTGCPVAPRNQPAFPVKSQSTNEKSKAQTAQAENDTAEESSFSVTNTSSSLNTLRSQMSNTMHSCNSPSSDSATKDMSKSLPSPRDTRHQDIIVEVDEDADNSYEFLEREEAQGLAFETPNRKRKRLLHRSDLIHFRRPGLAAIDLAASKLVDLHPGQSQPKPKTKVMQKLGLSRGHHKRHPAEHARSLTDVEDNEESPTKKIRVLQSEINRLRQELENEKTKSAQRNSMYMSLDRADRRASQSIESPHVTFSPRSPLFVSSPVSSSRASSRPCQLLSPSRGLPNSKRNSGMTDSPVVVKRPCDGATVGGSPFIVSRVFGQGPDVVGESTPAQAEKWLQKKKATSATQGGMRRDLFGAKSSKAAQSSSGSAAGRPTSANSNASSGWNRDQELEADLFSSPRAKTLKKLNRNSKNGLSAMQPRSNIRNMFRNSINDFHRHGGPSSSSRPSTAGAQPPDMATFLNELKASGRSKLRKTPGSAKYYNMHRSIGSPKSNPRKYLDPIARRSVDCHNANLLSSVLQNYPANSQRHPKPLDGSSSSRGTASSANTHDADSPNTPTASKHQSQTSQQCRSPLSRKVYPSGNPTKSHETAHSDVHVVLGEAISTPRKSKRAGHLSRSLVDPHMTPRARAFANVIQPTSPIEREFTMDELIQQVKELKDHQTIADEEAGGPPVSRADNKLRNHDLVHEMGFCSSNENSLEIGSFSQAFLSGGSNPSTAFVSPVTNSRTASQESNRPRSSPMLKSLTPGRPKPKTSPTKGSNNRWSSQSTIRLVSILNHSIDGGNALGESSSANPAASVRAKPNERRVRILEDHTNLNKSRSSTEADSRRHSMPVHLANPTSLATFSEDENEQPEDSRDQQPPRFKVAQPWVVLKPDADRLANAEPNVRRWSLRTSAIISAHPKIV
ncbi:hypothetical protein PtB15_5B160 [Puccinia triticina]|nr:hypothetical protein PtB15_5B160 [Puccinia triticina]